MGNKARTTVGIAVAVLTYLLVSTYPKWVPLRWQEFSSQEGQFAVLMPGTPEIKTETLAGQKIELHMFTIDRGSVSFMSSYFDLPPTSVPPDTILDSARDGSIRKMEGTLISEEKINLDGHPGRAFKSTARGNNFVDTRMYLVAERLYMLTVAHQDRENSDAPKFLSSFKLLSAKP